MILLGEEKSCVTYFVLFELLKSQIFQRRSRQSFFAFVITVAVIGVGLLVYFKNRKR